MSYTPTTWQDGDVITASLMNKMEQGISKQNGIARICINFNVYPPLGNGGGTLFCSIGYAKQDSNLVNGYSIESPLIDYFSYYPHAKFYLLVNIPDASDDLKPFVFFNESIDSIANYTITGDISHTKIAGHSKLASSVWSSEPFYGFEISGDGQIEVRYQD